MSFEIRIKGKSYSGAKSGSVNIGIDSLANSFNAVVTNFWSESITAIKAGDLVEIYADNVKRFTGWIDQAEPAFSNDGNFISISGRSKSGDLIDCTPDAEQSEFKKQSFESLVAALADPFELSITKNVDTGEIIETANYEQGESIFDFLKREAIKKGLLMYSDASGNLVIDKAGSLNSGLAFIDGENILDCSASIDYSERYSKYIVKGDQQSNPYIDEESATQSQAIATDEEIRYRPLIIMLDGNATKAICEQRAKWEASSRIAKSVSYTVEAQGWFWNLNEKCILKSNRIGANETLLIKRIKNSFSESGRISSLELIKPKAFEELPELKVEKDKKDNPFLKLSSEELNI